MIRIIYGNIFILGFACLCIMNIIDISYDKENAKKKLDSFKEQCKVAVELSDGIKINGKFSNICVCGMGGSGVGGKLLKPFEKDIPIIVHNDYGLPKSANKDSLVFIISYSGNTEEALSSFEDARKKKAKIMAITSGGKLAELDKNAIIVPAGYQPRETLGYLFLTMLCVLSRSRLIAEQEKAVSEMIDMLDSESAESKGMAIARKIHGKIPVFYAAEEMSGVVYRMKCQINENAKQPAYCNVIPEMDHNEINGFKILGSRMAAVFISDKNNFSKVRKRFEVTKDLISNDTTVVEIETKGNSLLARMFYALYIIDYASFYLAMLNKIDPSSIPLIGELKKRLG